MAWLRLRPMGMRSTPAKTSERTIEPEHSWPPVWDCRPFGSDRSIWRPPNGLSCWQRSTINSLRCTDSHARRGFGMLGGEELLVAGDSRAGVSLARTGHVHGGRILPVQQVRFGYSRRFVHRNAEATRIHPVERKSGTSRQCATGCPREQRR